MARKPARLALLPIQPPRVSKNPVLTVSKRVRFALDGFERQIGGRSRLIYLLTCHTNKNPEIIEVRDIVSNPETAHLPLADVCAYARLEVYRLFEAIRDAALSNAEVVSFIDLPARIPKVTAEIITQALPHQEECPVCYGAKIDPKQKVGKKADEDPAKCRRCRGKGTITIKGSLEHQRLALELAKLIKSGGFAKLAISTNVNVQQPAIQGGSLEQLQQAVGELMYGKREIIDVVPTESPAPAAPQAAPVVDVPQIGF